MGKYCHPNLSLWLCTRQNNRSSIDSDSMNSQRVQPEQQQITIFYNGRSWVCDVTELQARAILCMARREMEERSTEKKSQRQGDSSPPSSHPSSLLEQPQLINPDLSMKRSLQRFLERRKTRLDASSPYGCLPS